MFPKIRRFVRLHTQFVLYSAMLLIGSIGIIFVLIPAIQNSIALARDLQTLTVETSHIQQKVTSLSALDDQILQQTAQDVLSAVPAERSVSTLLSTVEAVAVKNGLSIADLSIEGIASLATGSARPATKIEGNSLLETISLQGELTQVRNFLADCVKVRRLMRIKTISLNSLPRTTLVTVKLTIEMFYTPLPLSIGKPSDPLEPFSQKELATLTQLGTYPVVYATSAQLPLGGSSVVGVEPATPAVIDPFYSSSRYLPVLNVPITLTPTPPLARSGATPTVSPRSTPSPKPTVKPTTAPTLSPTP